MAFSVGSVITPVTLDYDAALAMSDAYERELSREQLYEGILLRCHRVIYGATTKSPPQYSAVFTVPKAVSTEIMPYDDDVATDYLVAALRDRGFRVWRLTSDEKHRRGEPHRLYIRWDTREHVAEKQRRKQNDTQSTLPSDPPLVRELRQRHRSARGGATPVQAAAKRASVKSITHHRAELAGLLDRLPAKLK